MAGVEAVGRRLFQQALGGDLKAVKGLVELGRLNEAISEAIQKSTPFAPEDLEILQDALTRQKAGEPDDGADEEGGNRS
jgi:hypothetical protein